MPAHSCRTLGKQRGGSHHPNRPTHRWADCFLVVPSAEASRWKLTPGSSEASLCQVAQSGAFGENTTCFFECMARNRTVSENSALPRVNSLLSFFFIWLKVLTIVKVCRAPERPLSSCGPLESPHPPHPSPHLCTAYSVCSSALAFLSRWNHISSRRWFVWSQRRLHDRCFFPCCETPPPPSTCTLRQFGGWWSCELLRQTRSSATASAARAKHVQMLAVSLTAR